MSTVQDLYSDPNHPDGGEESARVIAACRGDFPFFANNPDVAYLDSAATAQKPQIVLDVMSEFYARENANVHRGAYPIADEASRRFEEARKEIAAFIGATRDEVVFTKNATEALNIAAHGICTTKVSAGEEILLTNSEHHANLVPWQVYAARVGAKLEFVQIGIDGELSLDAVRAKISSRTKALVITHCSNVFGVLNPVREIAELAHKVGAVVVVDAAQSVAHAPVNVAELGCDVLAFSGHKLGGPTGIGVLFSKQSLMSEWPPLMFGGGMVDTVTLERTTFAPPPHRFEAGTPPIAEALGLAAAVRYLKQIGMKEISNHCYNLRGIAADAIGKLPGIKMIGPRSGGTHGGILSFVFEGVHNHDVAWFCGDRGVCLRAGSHCAQPLLTSLGFDGSLRASFFLYSTEAEVHRLAALLAEASASLRKGAR